MFVSMWHVEAANIKVFSVLQLQFGPQYLAVCGQFRLFNREAQRHNNGAVRTPWMESKMSARRSRRIRLYERHRQWELELIPDKEDDDDDVQGGLFGFRKRVAKTVSAIFRCSVV
ncbi:hypothetical protein ACOMHN_036722 [Nucella lapillus]